MSHIQTNPKIFTTTWVRALERPIDAMQHYIPLLIEVVNGRILRMWWTSCTTKECLDKTPKSSREEIGRLRMLEMLFNMPGRRMGLKGYRGYFRIVNIFEDRPIRESK